MLKQHVVVIAFGALLGCAPEANMYIDIAPAVRTQPVANDPDDPAIWIHPADGARSLVIGTNKVKAPDGAVVVFGLDGAIRQTIAGLDRPNNVDVEDDLAVVTERLENQLRVFRIRPDGSGIDDVTSPGKTLVVTEPMGVSIYKRPGDGALFAIVAPKTGSRSDYLAQYRLQKDEKGLVGATLVRRFGTFSGAGEIEAVAVDDALGYVYYADEGNGIHKYHADPEHKDAAREVAHFGTSGFKSDREGIAIYARPDGTGYVVCTDQIEGGSEYRVYSRDGEHKLVKILRRGADSTDGLEITSRPVGPGFPNGLMVAMNSKDRNFLIYKWPESLR